MSTMLRNLYKRSGYAYALPMLQSVAIPILGFWVMSAGKFTSTFYQMSTDNGGYVLACRVQPETKTATIDGTANAGHAGPATGPGSATISQGRRTAGVNMRYVTFEWTGTLPTGYSGDNVKIPVLTAATYAAWTIGKTGTYLENPVKVVGRSPETVK